MSGPVWRAANLLRRSVCVTGRSSCRQLYFHDLLKCRAALGRGIQSEKISLPVPIQNSVRSMSQQQSQTEPKDDAQSSQPEVIILLRANFIPLIRLAMRVKHLNLAVATYLFGYQLLSSTATAWSMLQWGGLAGFTAISLAGCVLYSKIALGLAYLPEERLIRVSSLGYDCRRKDFLVNAESIVPFVDGKKQSVDQVLYRLEVYGSKQWRYYTLQHSDVREPKLLADLFWLPPELGGTADRAWKGAQESADEKAAHESREQSNKS